MNKLSIIIQSYERPNFLQGCLDRLEKFLIPNLTETKYEIIIADDGSKNEEIYKVIDNFKLDKKCYFNKDKKNQGPGHTLNRANELVTGNYVLHLEDDFWLDKEMNENDIKTILIPFQKIEGLELIRLRSLYDKPEGIRHRLYEYENATEPEIYQFDNKEFRVFKKYKLGGPFYQYTGNAHIRKSTTLKNMGYYIETGCIAALENNTAAKFYRSNFKSGVFKDGWFIHTGFNKSTKTMK